MSVLHRYGKAVAMYVPPMQCSMHCQKAINPISARVSRAAQYVHLTASQLQQVPGALCKLCMHAHYSALLQMMLSAKGQKCACTSANAKKSSRVNALLRVSSSVKRDALMQAGCYDCHPLS